MIHGIFYRTAQNRDLHYAVSQNDLELLASPFHQELASLSLPNCWLSQAVEKNLEAPHDKQLFSYGTPARAVITAWARIDNREELCEKLCISKEATQNISSSELILRAYIKYGENCTDHLIGDFSFVIYDIEKNQLFCARDHMGIKPFYYYIDQHIFAFSSSLSFFHKIPTIEINPCMEWASRFLINQSLAMHFEKTPYHKISKLPGAHQLTVTNHLKTKKRYFEFHTNKLSLSSSEEYVAYYREHLDNAIRDRARVNSPLGSELSGGIDSSTVTAFALNHFPGQIEDFHAFGFAALEKEPKRILGVSQQLGILMNHICCRNRQTKPDPILEYDVLGAPNQHSNALGHLVFYQMAKAFGVRTLLSGFGGDEFVTTIHDYLYLHELIKNKQYLTLYKNLAGNTLSRPLRFLKYTLESLGKPGVKNTAMANAYKKRWPHHIVNEQLTQSFELKSRHLEQGLFDQGYDDLDRFTLENRLAPFISTRTEECTLVAASYGVDYRWPLLDVRLIQAFLSIPTSEKYYRGTGRYLHKRAITGIVPQEVATQKSKYMGEHVPLLNSKKEKFEPIELHNDLLRLIDHNKYQKQVAYLSELSESQQQPTKSNQLFQLRKNIKKVQQLNEWLHHFFPNGCNWANSPSENII